MKHFYLAILVTVLAFIISACDIEEFYLECDGFYISPYTEDFSDAIDTFPYKLPYTVTIRVMDANGNRLYSGSLMSLSAAGIFRTNGGFHEFSRPAEAQPLQVFINVPEEAEGLIAEVLTVDCGGTLIYFNDGRIGPDTGTTLNAYRQNNELVIYSEENGSFLVSFDQIAAMGNPTQNTLISSHNGVEVYLLSDGLIQIMETVAPDGKRDILIIDLDDEGLVTRWQRGTFNAITGISNIHSQSDGWDGYPVIF